jgi:hypothetical protein
MCLMAFIFEEVVPLPTSDAKLNPAAEFQT